MTLPPKLQTADQWSPNNMLGGKPSCAEGFFLSCVLVQNSTAQNNNELIFNIISVFLWALLSIQS